MLAIYILLAIYISASWLQNAVGEVVSQPSSPCRLRVDISAELSAARCKPYVSKSQGKLSGAVAAPAASFPVRRHWGGLAAPPRCVLALLLCREQPERWHCPGAVAGTTASLFFKLWTPQKPPSLVFSMKTMRRREKAKSFIWYQSSPWLLQLIPVYCVFRGAQMRVKFWRLQLTLVWQPHVILAKQWNQEQGVEPLGICATKLGGPLSQREQEGKRNQSHLGQKSAQLLVAVPVSAFVFQILMNLSSKQWEGEVVAGLPAALPLNCKWFGEPDA